MYNNLVQLCLWATYLFDLNQYVFSVQWKKIYSTLNVLTVFDVNLTSTLRNLGCAFLFRLQNKKLLIVKDEKKSIFVQHPAISTAGSYLHLPAL